MTKIDGIPFKNSPECYGAAYCVDNAPTDMSIIQIDGQYPDSGCLARNRECDEMVYVTKGFGSLAIRGAEIQELYATDVVYVPAGAEFAWDGHMELVMACTPPFYPEQYDCLNWLGVMQLVGDYFPSESGKVGAMTFDQATHFLQERLSTAGKDPAAVMHQYDI